MTNLEHIKRQILQSIDLSALISEKVPLKARSGNKVGLCPFHKEKTPSFTVFDDHYFCFGCREHGDAIDFVRKTQGLGFMDALHVLAQKAGLPAEVLQSRWNYKKERQKEERMYAALQEAQAFFRSQLLESSEGHQAQEYLKKRGFTATSIESFGFGLAPRSQARLTHHLKEKGYSTEILEACSLSNPSTHHKGYVDFFRNRLMIPIHDVHGRLVAFGGRTLDDSYGPKYKNSRDSIIFDKSKILFGLDKSRKLMRQENLPAYIVEGYMDVLKMWQAGIKTAVACMGVALKETHLKQLSQACRKAYVVFDGDFAGQSASLSVVSAALNVPDLNLSVIRLPEQHDPDSYIEQFGADAFLSLTKSADDLLDFVMRSKLGQTPKTAWPQLLSDELLPWLAQLEDPLKQGFLMHKISFLTGIDQNTLRMRLYEHGPIVSSKSAPAQQPTVTRSRTQGAVSASSKQQKTDQQEQEIEPPQGIAFEILGHLYYAQPGEINTQEIKNFLTLNPVLTSPWLELAQTWLDVLDSSSPSSQPRTQKEFSYDLVILKFIEELQAKAQAFTVTHRHEKLNSCLRHWLVKKKRNDIDTLTRKIPLLQDQQQLRQLLSCIQQMQQEVAHLQKSIKT